MIQPSATGPTALEICPEEFLVGVQRSQQHVVLLCGPILEEVCHQKGHAGLLGVSMQSLLALSEVVSDA
jgi:hypothetical protein